MSNLENKFKEKLYNVETPLGGSVSFEKVMAMRNKNRGIQWWKPALLVTAALSVVMLAGYVFFRDGSGQNASNSSAIATGASSGQNHEANQSNTQNGNYSGKSISGAQDRIDADVAARSGVINNNADQVVSTKGKTAIQNRNHRNHQVTPVETVTETQPQGEMTNEDAHIFDGSGLAAFGIRYVEMAFNVPAYGKKLKLAHKFRLPDKEKNLPAVELMMATGNRNIKEYSTLNAYAVRGSHHYTQFSGTALWDLGKGWKAGAGLGYSQFAGTGEWRNMYSVNSKKITYDTTIIVQPGMPDKMVIKADTAMVAENKVETGKINYTFSKVCVPIAFQYYMGHGSSLFRINGVVSPGIISAQSGYVFNREQTKNTTGSINTMTLDARLGFGLYYVMSKRVGLIVEPGVTYQSVLGSGWNNYSRAGFGMGFGLMIKL